MKIIVRVALGDLVAFVPVSILERVVSR